MKKTILALLILVSFSMITKANWLNSYDNAVEMAKKKNLPILVDVSGKNWCIWCKRLYSEVFNNSDFITFAKKNLVLLLIDVPNPRSPSREAKLFMNKFPINGYPTVFLLGTDGKILFKTGYLPGGPTNYINTLKPFIKTLKVKKPQQHTFPKPIHNNQTDQNNFLSSTKNIIVAINIIIHSAFKQGDDLENESVQEDILNIVNKKFPCQINYKASKVSNFDIDQLASTLAKKKYSKDLNKLKQEYNRQAAEKYHTASINDSIKIRFRKAGMVYTVSGTFYGYTMSGNGVIIGRSTIPVFDLIPASQYLFSKTLCEKMKKKYVKNKVKLYFHNKNAYAEKQKPIARKMLIASNVDVGYIFYKNKWITPNKLAQSMLNKQINEQNINRELILKNKKIEKSIISDLKLKVNPYILIPLVLILGILGICSFVCLIISFVRMFQHGKTVMGIICIILSIFSGLGPTIAFIYSWAKSSEFGIKKLMKFWTYCVVINTVVSIILIWQCYSVILELITKQ